MKVKLEDEALLLVCRGSPMRSHDLYVHFDKRSGRHVAAAVNRLEEKRLIVCDYGYTPARLLITDAGKERLEEVGLLGKVGRD